MDIRLAGPADLPALRELDHRAFPEGSIDLEPSASNELERGLENDELSPFSIFRRHQRTVVGTVLMYLTSLLPMLAAPIELLFGSQGLWVLLSGSVLLLRFGWQARRKSFEGQQVIATREASEKSAG